MQARAAVINSMVLKELEERERDLKDELARIDARVAEQTVHSAVDGRLA